MIKKGNGQLNVQVKVPNHELGKLIPIHHPHLQVSKTY